MKNRLEQLSDYLTAHADEVKPVVDFIPTDSLLPFDFTGFSPAPDAATIADIPRFSQWVNQQLSHTNSRYGIGGYAENRTLYAAKSLFEDAGEPRSLHLGTDIWGPAGTRVYCPLHARVHSFANNDRFGDYGATIILVHAIADMPLYSLYGHLNLASIQGLAKHQYIPAGEPLAALGNENENGHWPPHLHFQLMFDMMDKEGDFPGVCKPSEQDKWLANSPDPGLVLKYTFG